MPAITATDLIGRTIKIEASQLPAWFTCVTFADTGESIDNVERVEIDIDVLETIKAKLHLVHIDKTSDEGIVREEAETTDVTISTLARVEGVQ